MHHTLPTKVTRKSHNNFIIFINWSSIIWYNKRQNIVTCEASTLSSEFIVPKCCVEHIIAVAFKSRMSRFPINGLAKMFVTIKALLKTQFFYHLLSIKNIVLYCLSLCQPKKKLPKKANGIYELRLL